MLEIIKGVRKNLKKACLTLQCMLWLLIGPVLIQERHLNIYHNIIWHISAPLSTHFGPSFDTFRPRFDTLCACGSLRSISIVSTPRHSEKWMMYCDVLICVLNVCSFRWSSDVALTRYNNGHGRVLGERRWYSSIVHNKGPAFPQSLGFFLVFFYTNGWQNGIFSCSWPFIC